MWVVDMKKEPIQQEVVGKCATVLCAMGNLVTM